MASLKEQYDRLHALVTDVEQEVAKATGGNKAAGTRVRKVMQDVKKAAQDVRNAVLGKGDAGDTSEG